MGQNIISDAACSTTAERLWWLCLSVCVCMLHYVMWWQMLINIYSSYKIVL